MHIHLEVTVAPVAYPSAQTTGLAIVNRTRLPWDWKRPRREAIQEARESAVAQLLNRKDIPQGAARGELTTLRVERTYPVTCYGTGIG